MATVYAAALNFKGTLDRLGGALYRDPYKSPPRAPVLAIKPANCRIASGTPIICPAGVDRLRMGGTLAVVIGDSGRIGGFAIANDVSIPHDSYYRPAIEQRCRDGFCPIGPVVETRNLPDPDRAGIRILVNGRLACTDNTANLVRSIPRLLADIAEFMTLSPGDILLVGEPDSAPLAGPGDRVRVEIDGLGAIENSIV